MEVISITGSRTVPTLVRPVRSIFSSMFRTGMSSMTGIPYSSVPSSMALLSTISWLVTLATVPEYTWEQVGFAWGDTCVSILQ